MFFVAFPSGESVFPGVVHLSHKDAEKYAARRLNDPPVRADMCPHIPRRLWRDKGYVVLPVPVPVYGCPAKIPEYGCTAGILEYGCTAGILEYGCTAEIIDLEFWNAPTDPGGNAEEPTSYGWFSEVA